MIEDQFDLKNVQMELTTFKLIFARVLTKLQMPLAEYNLDLNGFPGVSEPHGVKASSERGGRGNRAGETLSQQESRQSRLSEFHGRVLKSKILNKVRQTESEKQGG